MSILQNQVFDFQDVRQSLKLIGRAYQKRSVAMIELCRLFFEISPGNWCQVFALKSLIDTIDEAIVHAVKAGKDKNADADKAFADAEEEVNRYAKLYHPGYKAVLGDMQNIIHLATKEDNDIMKHRLSGSLSLLPRQSSRVNKRVFITPGNALQVRIRFQILTCPYDRLNSQTLTFELDTEVKIIEVLWILARLSEVNLRITPRDVPHFYLSKDLPDQSLAYTEEFILEPLKDLRPESDLLVLALIDRPRTGKIFFECGKFCKTYTNIWKPHDIIILKDLQGTIKAASHISPLIQGEVRIWKRGKTQSPGLTDWTDVFDQALQYPYVDWLIRTETSPSEAIRIKYIWELVPLGSFQPAPLISSNPMELPLPAQVALTPASSSNSSAASNVVISPPRTRTEEIPGSQREVMTRVPPLASGRSTQNRDQPDVAYDPHTGATSAPEARSPLDKHNRPAEVTGFPGGPGLENPHASVPTNAGRRSVEGTRPRFSTAPPLVQISYSPLERLALSIEDVVTSIGGSLTTDANEMLTSWPRLERSLSHENILIDPLAVLAAAARDSSFPRSSS